MTEFPHLTPYVDYFEVAKNELVEQWMSNSDVVAVLQKHNITTEFYGQYFGVKIINYALGIIRGSHALGNCPVIGVMLVFFEKKQIALDEVFMICVNLKNTLLQFMLKEKILTYETLTEIALLIDHNFLGVIRDYIQLYYFQKDEYLYCSINPEESMKPKVCNTYQGNDKTDTTTALHYLQEVEIDLEMIDELGAIEKEAVDSIDLTNAMDDEAYREIIILLNDYIHVVNYLTEFKELAYTLTLLVELLETTPLESISFDNSGVVAIYLKAIIEDLSMWRKSVFVDQIAEDIHYLDKTLFSSVAQLQITLSEGDNSGTEAIEFF
ncbi:MAG: hypothetical protein NTY39_08330 [Campylobacterales bacterium]|nr:hypothetical protein [Campylobacterales bacterium]